MPTMKVSRTRFVKCNCLWGGGLSAGPFTSFSAHDCEFIKCTSGNGAGILTTAAICNVYTSTFTECKAGNNGAIDVSSSGGGTFPSTTTATACHFRFCSADSIHGAVGASGASAKAILNDCHALSCSAGSSAGAYGGESDSTLVINGGTITKCRADVEGGAVAISSGVTATMQDVLVEECEAGGPGQSSKGGGAYLYAGSSLIATRVVFKLSFAQRGGALFCNGGTAMLTDVLMSMGSAVYGGACLVLDKDAHLTATRLNCTHTAGTNEQYSDAVANTVWNNPCTAACPGGGGVHIGSAQATSVFDDSEFSYGTALSGGALLLSGGSHKLTNCRFLHNRACRRGGGLIMLGTADAVIRGSTFDDHHAIGNVASAQGGGSILTLAGTQLEIVDTTISRSTSELLAGAAIRAEGDMKARNLTIRSSRSVDDSGIFISSESLFDAAILNLEPSCDTGGHAIPSITSDGLTSSILRRVRGVNMLRPSGCSLTDSELTARVAPAGDDAAFPLCAVGGLCGADAMCTDTPIGDSTSAEGSVRSAACSCEAPNSPMAVDTVSKLVSPYTHPCDTPRMGAGVGIASLEIDSIVLELLKPATDSRTLTLRMKGSKEANVTWAIDPNSVPSWMTLGATAGRYTSAADEANIVTLTAASDGLPESPSPYEAFLGLTVSASVDVKFAVPVILFVTSRDNVSKSVWGKVKGSCITDAVAPSSAAFVDREFMVPFTSCDANALPVAHILPSDSDARIFTASYRFAQEPASAALDAEVRADVMAASVYDVIMTPQFLGVYIVTVALDGVPLGGGSFIFNTTCVSGTVPTPEGQCGCPQGTRPVGDKCEECPAGFSSSPGERECSHCAERFFHPLSSDGTVKLDECAPCLSQATCPWSSTTETLLTKIGNWRIASGTEDIFECNARDGVSACLGGPPGQESCVTGHGGPMCSVCTENMQYMRDHAGVCEKCPDGNVPIYIALGVLAVSAVMFKFIHLILTNPPKQLAEVSKRFKLFSRGLVLVGPSKIKLAVTFYQITSSFDQTFDLEPMSSDFKELLDVIEVFKFDWSEAAYPMGCLTGGYLARLLMVAATPFILMLIVPLALVVVTWLANFICPGSKQKVSQSLDLVAAARGSWKDSFFMRSTSSGRVAEGSTRNSPPSSGVDGSTRSSHPISGIKRPSPQENKNSWLNKLYKLFPFVSLVIFVMLPAVTRSIFAVWNCKEYSQGPGLPSRAFLAADPSVECDTPEHRTLIGVGVFLVILWPVGMTLLLSGVMWMNRKNILSGKRTPATHAITLLTGGFKQHLFFWEVIEISRRLICCSFVVLIPPDQMFFRAALLFLISLPVLVLTAVFQPCRSKEDNLLSIIAQTFLLFCFAICTVLSLINFEDLDSAGKEAMLGFSSPNGLFVAIIFFIVGFFALIVLVYGVQLNGRIKLMLVKKGETRDKYSFAMMYGTGILCACLGLPLFFFLFGLLGGVLGGVLFGLLGSILGAVLSHSLSSCSFCSSTVHKSNGGSSPREKSSTVAPAPSSGCSVEADGPSTLDACAA